MRNKAIAFVVYNRIEYFVKTLKAWAKVKNLEEYDIYFFMEPCHELNTMLDIINIFSEKIGFEVTIIANDEVVGNAKNVWNAFDTLFVKYDFVILAEDDILPSQDTANYFTALEEKYRNDSSVAIISANNKGGTANAVGVIRIDSFPGLIWGTWAKYWHEFFKATWDFNYTTGTEKHPQSGWDWNLSLRIMPLFNLKTIHPLSSRSQHIGINGIHCNEGMFDSTKSISFKENHEWEDLVEV